jgi:hypothetical protein
MTILESRPFCARKNGSCTGIELMCNSCPTHGSMLEQDNVYQNRAWTEALQIYMAQLRTQGDSFSTRPFGVWALRSGLG